MSKYQTPGVYVEEVSTLPPSVAQVATAIPAFIGYTEKGPKDKAVRITSMLEFESIFGGPQAEEFTFNVTEDELSGVPSLGDAEKKASQNFMLYYSMKLFFANGGGVCYIVSVRHYSEQENDEKGRFIEGLTRISEVDEPTLIVLTDAMSLGADTYHDLCQEAVNQCATLKDRFTIIDIQDDDTDGSQFRNRGLNNLSYAAAYTPHLQTTINYAYDETKVELSFATGQQDEGGETSPPTVMSLSELKESNTAIYNQVKTELAKQYVVLPPGPAMAGIYAQVDGSRGVWKAPANVAVAGVVGPTRIISNEEQGSLNVDPTSGKSINAIRSFTGKGTLVWGARTLAGNDNEWRYINVRRLFITIEESVQKASAFAVFEPNDASTWLKVKAMIDNYLYGLWQQGALAGPTPESSYFVNIGLGKTMTSQDILEGRMNVEIGIAAVRPAEFIVLKFSHKLQEA